MRTYQICFGLIIVHINRMKKILLPFILLFTAFQSQAQLSANKYWIQFADKNNNGFITESPEQFLSLKSIERRVKYGISIRNRDLPVTESYVLSITQTGANVILRSKWMNGVVVFLNDSNLLTSIEQLPFVVSSRKLARTKPKTNADELKETLEMFMEQIGAQKGKDIKQKTASEIVDYGLGFNQIEQINGIDLHKSGRMGQGMQIAVFDAGFPQVDTLPVFKRLRDDNRIIGMFDVVNNSVNVIGFNSHGRSVLSTMAAWKDGLLVGTAPLAEYFLVRTEDAATEYVIEEYNWLRGAELVDSAGVDIINSSLGYTQFDEATQSHTFADLNGNTTVITRAADWAAATGMLVVNSAGNSGDSPWRYIGAPADADSILTIGAVDSLGIYASFSSQGPTADGRIKPNVTALGKLAAVATGTGSVIRGNGTSFSGPIIAGMAACLWQGHRDKNAQQIIKAIEQSASRASNPDNYYGFGIPDFGKADYILRNLPPIDQLVDSIVNVYPNPMVTGITLEFFSTQLQSAKLEITSLNGKRVHSETVQLKPFFNNIFSIQPLRDVKQGIYIITIFVGNKKYTRQVVKSSN